MKEYINRFDRLPGLYKVLAYLLISYLIVLFVNKYFDLGVDNQVLMGLANLVIYVLVQLGAKKNLIQ